MFVWHISSKQKGKVGFVFGCIGTDFAIKIQTVEEYQKQLAQVNETKEKNEKSESSGVSEESDYQTSEEQEDE